MQQLCSLPIDPIDCFSHAHANNQVVKRFACDVFADSNTSHSAQLFQQWKHKTCYVLSVKKKVWT